MNTQNLFSRDSKGSGSALVLTLLAVVLVSLAVLAFFASVTSNRSIENSRAHNTQADQMVRTACDYVAGQFLTEISNPSYSSATTNNAVIIYAPRANTNAVPLRIITSTLTSSSDYLNLIRQSIAGADPNASSDNSGAAAQNGPAIGTNQWNAPMLLTAGGFNDSSQLPDWVYVDRVNGVTKTAASTSTIGRFAYNVYNIGGLLNANVAGYPTAVATAGASVIGPLKSTEAGADLTQITGVNQTDVDGLAAFRNLATSTGANAYLSLVTNSVATGFLDTMVTNAASPTTIYTNNFFNGRQDLLRYARTQNSGDLLNAAPYLTTFSKSVNAPSWSPPALAGSTVNYASGANTAGNANRFIPNVRATAAGSIPHWKDDGTADTPTIVQKGDPLIQRRFSLAKLAWITHTGPAAGISAQAIQACFGLVWNSSNTSLATPPQSDPRWDYVGNGTGAQSSIETLDAVASEHREPNFFELLQAGILSGSLGQTGLQNGRGDGISEGNIEGYEINHNYQIIRIGADIIDQSRTDNYPTAIEFNGFEFWGIKDLPYINKLLPIISWAGAVNLTLPPKPPVYLYYGFELWNPHQPPAIQSTTTIPGPTKFRIRANTDGEYRVGYVEADGQTWEHPNDFASFAGCANNPLTFGADNTSGNLQLSYRDPRAIRTGTQQTTVGGSDVLQMTTDTEGNPLAPTFRTTIDVRLTVFVLEYLDQNGSYRPYSTFDGQEEAGGLSGMGGSYGYDGPAMGATAPQSSSTSINSSISGVIPKIDPRTFRFDVLWEGGPVDASFRPTDASYSSAGYYKPYFTSADGTPSEMARFASNNSGNSGYFYPDPDGIVRPGDDWYNDQNPYGLFANEASQRPIILDRPFRSVGELGYAYRDLPFKTLDLFTATSADAGLLDLFSVNDEPSVVAGRVDQNTAQPLVRQSLLAGNPDLQNYSLNSATLASDYQTYAFNSGTPTATIPETQAQLANFLYGATLPSANPGALPAQPTTLATVNLKTAREAAVRALADPVQTRTWNLLIDVVAQSGRFTGASTAGNSFVVEGEKHCWLSIAIDRYTGKIVDQQLEFINE